MDLNAENPFGDLMNKAVKLKGHQQAQLRTKFDAWPQYFQHSMFMQESVLSVREYAFPERITAAESMKVAGSNHYSNGLLEEAVAEYEKALAVFKYCENMDPGWKKKGIEDKDIRLTDYSCTNPQDQERLNALKISCYLNIAMCKFKLKEYSICIHACNDVLKINPKNVKAMYRRALALITPASSGALEFERALADMHTAYEIEPQNRDVRKLYRELREQKIRQKKLDRETFTGMFERGQVYDVDAATSDQAAIEDLDDEAREKKFQEEVEEAERLARLCESKGQEAHANEIREKVENAKQIRSRRLKQVDFFNPTPEMIEDGKKQGIDLTDIQVQRMLHELQEDERKKAKDPTYVPPDRLGPAAAAAASEVESVDSILNSMSNAQIAQLLTREGIDYHNITDRTQFLETARQVLRTKFGETSSKPSQSYFKTIFFCALVWTLVRMYSSGSLAVMGRLVMNLITGSASTIGEHSDPEDAADFFDD